MKELADMPRFAVYFVPPSRSPFYRLGTSLVRYDVRSQQMMYPDNPIRAQIPQFREEYVESSKLYGLHSTIVGSYEFDMADLSEIEATISDVLSCFDPASHFMLRTHREFVSFWGEKKDTVVLRYDPNAALIALHTMLLTRLVRFGKSSAYYPKYKDSAGAFSETEWQRIRHFYHPHVLDGYTPHFTLLNPYTEVRYRKEVERVLRSLFGKFTTHKIESICLMVQENDEDSWQIHREFER